MGSLRLIDKLKESSAEHLTKLLIGSVIAGFFYFLVSIESFIIPWVDQLATIVIIRAFVFLMIIICCLLLYLVHLPKKLTFDRESGAYFDNKGNPYCPSCHSNKRISPLQVGEKFWNCMNKDCKACIRDPNYKDERPKVRNTGQSHHSSDPWLRRRNY